MFYCHTYDIKTGAKDTEITPRAPGIIFFLVKIESTNKSFTEYDKDKFFMRYGRKQAACTFQ
jgi:hypothetical protein